MVLMAKIYRNVLPEVHKNLTIWKEQAHTIPDPELRKQALLSIETKTFHCEGGAIYGILAGKYLKESIRFIVAYQTISDYLDNLCDRSTSLDPTDFRLLHQSMFDALTPDAKVQNYYLYRNEQNDGGYLIKLVKTCQEVIKTLPLYSKIVPILQELAGYYCDLQVHKHVRVDERVPRLKKWFGQYKDQLPDLTWYEFSACTGSTLGIFCLVSYAFHADFKAEYIEQVRRGMFPYVQGLHILLDYFIDQDEDRKEGDLNFCFYYPDQEKLIERFGYFIKKADQHIKGMPDEKFHQLMNKGLIGIYLSDQKVQKQKEIRTQAKKMIRYSGFASWFFYFNGKVYRKILNRKY